MVGRRIPAHSLQRRRRLLCVSATAAAAAAAALTSLHLPSVAAAKRPSLVLAFISRSPRGSSSTTTSTRATRLHSTFSNTTIIEKENAGGMRNVLPYREGSHNSVKIEIPPGAVSSIGHDDDGDDDGGAFDRSVFRERLAATIELCRGLKKSSLWVQVPMSRASLVEEMVDAGLRFHHASGETANLNLWLLDGTENKVPEYATHHVGVGALAINSRGEILCVRELRKNFMPWKVPGGLSELGEAIDEAVIREVMEETGVPCRFRSVISFRHTHNLQFGRSDLYFMCRLEPIEGVDEQGNPVIPKPVPQAGEIERAEWIPMQEYIDMISGEKGHPMMRHIMSIYEQNVNIDRTVISSIVPGRIAAPIYHASLSSKNQS